MNAKNLQAQVDSEKSVVAMLRNAPGGVYQFPMRSEFSNWRDEQRAWSKTAAMFDMGFHMTEVSIKGADVFRLLSDLGVNTFSNFAPGRAKQFVACNYEGYVIGDAVLFCLDEDEVVLVGPPIASRWVEFHAETGTYDAKVTRDEMSLINPNRRSWRFQLQGPKSMEIIAAAADSVVPDIKPFHIGKFTIAGIEVSALNHAMSGKSGLEMWGPREDGPKVWKAITDAGEPFGLVEAGALAYSTISLESGWFGVQVPAIYSGEKMREYREWLGTDTVEARGSIGGSFVSDNIEDYYVTPFEIGYGGLVKFDHEFIGRAALESIQRSTQRQKVWLRWDDGDVARLLESGLFDGDLHTKYLTQPYATYSTWPSDAVLVGDRHVGVSTRSGYTTNTGCWSSLATIDGEFAVDGTEVTVIWGEENGGTAKPAVERHVQASVRAVVHTSPLA